MMNTERYVNRAKLYLSNFHGGWCKLSGRDQFATAYEVAQVKIQFSIRKEQNN